MNTNLGFVLNSCVVRIVDDDEAHCEAMRFMLQCRRWKVHSYLNANEFLSNDQPSTPGYIILDVHMPCMSGLQLQTRLKETHAHVPIIFLTGYGNIDMAVHTMHEGAADFLQKPANPDRLLTAVEKACRKSIQWLFPFSCLTYEEAKEKLNSLTPREQQILNLCGVGLSNKMTGIRLNISERTVEAHRASICKKLKVHKIEEALHIAEIARS